jgi:hypothetical protein
MTSNQLSSQTSPPLSPWQRRTQFRPLKSKRSRRSPPSSSRRCGEARPPGAPPNRTRNRAPPPSNSRQCSAASARGRRSGPARGGYAPLAFPEVNRVCTGLLYVRAGHLTAQNGGFRPEQSEFQRAALKRQESSRQAGISVSVVDLGLGRFVASYHRPSTSQQIHHLNRCLFF